MRRILLLVSLILLFLIGCLTQPIVVCNKPYILVGTECCLDQNNNSVCDKDETINENKSLEKINETRFLPLPKPNASAILDVIRLDGNGYFTDGYYLNRVEFVIKNTGVVDIIEPLLRIGISGVSSNEIKLKNTTIKAKGMVNLVNQLPNILVSPHKKQEIRVELIDGGRILSNEVYSYYFSAYTYVKPEVNTINNPENIDLVGSQKYGYELTIVDVIFGSNNYLNSVSVKINQPSQYIPVRDIKEPILDVFVMTDSQGDLTLYNKMEKLDVSIVKDSSFTKEIPIGLRIHDSVEIYVLLRDGSDSTVLASANENQYFTNNQ